MTEPAGTANATNGEDKFLPVGSQDSTEKTGWIWQQRRIILGVMMLLVAVVGLSWLAPQMDDQTLVVYCAHDAEFSDPILRKFEEESGIHIVVRYDTEATKSLGLVNRLIAESREPQCDVFWNNELLGTLELAASGALEEYHSPQAEAIPAQFRDENGLWTGFSARLRMYILADNVKQFSDVELQTQLSERDLSNVAIAKPIFGTTLTQYCLWWALDGDTATKERHEKWKERGIRIADGNAATKNLVAGGACQIGFTDSDDYFVAKDAGSAVKGAPVKVQGKTICIPNTVSIIKGTRRREHAELLVNYLLSKETQLALANSPSRQIPLCPVESSELTSEVVELVEWSRDSASLKELLPARRSVLLWLRSEYGQ